MRVISFVVVAALILQIALTCPAAAESTEYEQWLVEAYPADGPGAAVIVIRDNEVLFRGASGMAEMELGVPLTADNVFRIGSITKQFTSAGILLLEEQGKLKVTDDINTYLPGFPTHGHTITIDNLLSHTSGIFNYTSIPGYISGPAIRKDVSTEELIEVFADLPMDFEPGTEYRYSNSGYVLLGAIIEKVSGQSYEEFMQAEIFDTLGLENTYHGGSQIIPGRVSGYQGSIGEYSNADFLSMTQPHAAGVLLSTVDDMAKWTTALFNRDLLSKASLKKMTADFKLNNGEHAGYGYGFSVGARFGEQEIAHSGGIHGFASSGIWLPKRKVYVVVLSNFASVSPGYLAARLAFDAAGVDYPRLATIDIDPVKFSEYVGVYKINDNETRSVGIEDGHLYTQRSGGGRSQILAYGEDAFFYPGSFTHLKFDRDRSKRVIAMDMHQGGGDKAERAKRISEAVEAERRVADVSPEVYDLWAGSYEIVPGTLLNVRRDGDRLMVQLTGQPAFEAFPSSTRRYFLKAVDAEIEFFVGDDGRANKLALYQGGTESTANRVD